MSAAFSFSFIRGKVERPASNLQLPTSKLRPRLSLDRTSPAEFLLQLRQRNLNHRRPSVRTAIRQIAAKQILDKFFNFEIAQRIIGFDGMPAQRLCDRLFTQPNWPPPGAAASAA